MASSFTYAESSLYGSDVEHFVSRRNQTGKTNEESSITTEVHYFRNRTNDDGSTALISVISNEPLRANSTELKVGTTKFAVTKFVEDGESRVVSTFISEESSSSSSSSSSCISSLSESAKKYITECIFKQFSNDNEELFRIDGTCEIFCPMNGTNTGWHRDGFQSGCYIGHALFEEEEEKGTAAWFEFALIPEQTVSDSRDYGTSSIDFCDRDHLLVHHFIYWMFTAMQTETASQFVFRRRENFAPLASGQVLLGRNGTRTKENSSIWFCWQRCWK